MWRGAKMPSLTESPEVDKMVIVMSSPMTIDSPFLRVRANMRTHRPFLVVRQKCGHGLGNSRHP